LSFLPVTIYARDSGAGETSLPGWNIKTNLLYDATATFNLGAEFRTGPRTSLDMSLNHNPWTFAENRKWRHILVQPEFRLWVHRTFDGHFFGLHGHYAFYNIGNLPHGPFTQYMKEHRFEGWLAGAGLSWGYRWNFRHRWALEATVGVGYARLSYDKFACGQCGEFLGDETKHYFGPTKVGLNLILGLGGKAVQDVPAATPVVIPPPVYEPELCASFITPEVEAVGVCNESSRACLDFARGSAKIVCGFRDNAAELQRIHSVIENVIDDPAAAITGITITGYASPDGTYADNLVLSKRRAQALKNHLCAFHGLPQELVTAQGAGEDWAGLDSLVYTSSIVEKFCVLEIMRGTGIFEGREVRLMELAAGAPYRQMKADLFPLLRRVEFRIDYTVAQSFPDCDAANVNAAAEALGKKDVDAAARHLSLVEEQSAEYWNNVGVLAWLQGDKAAAAEAFAKAGTAGASNAAELDKHMQTVNSGR
jgi:hypothetical protein